MIGALSATYIALIRKVVRPYSFNEFIPISLCNLIYKLITKSIANRIKLKLTKTISLELFGFLKDIQIRDVVEVAKECLHSIRSLMSQQDLDIIKKSRPFNVKP